MKTGKTEFNDPHSARDGGRDDRDKTGERTQESEIKLRVASEEENRLLQLVGRLELQLSAERELRERAEGRLRDFAGEVVDQWGYWKADGSLVTAGGLSTLERAFDVLGWNDDPHHFESLQENNDEHREG